MPDNEGGGFLWTDEEQKGEDNGTGKKGTKGCIPEVEGPSPQSSSRAVVRRPINATNPQLKPSLLLRVVVDLWRSSESVLCQQHSRIVVIPQIGLPLADT